MTKQSPHAKYKGHCLMCAVFLRGDGKWKRMKGSDLRRSGGKRGMKRKDYDQ